MRQRVYGLALGYEDVNDHDALRHDPWIGCWSTCSCRRTRRRRRPRSSWIWMPPMIRCTAPRKAASPMAIMATTLSAALHLRRRASALRAAWPAVRIILRADSGFCRDGLMTWCETPGVDHVFGLTKNARLIALIEEELAETRGRCTKTSTARAARWRIASRSNSSCARPRPRPIRSRRRPTRSAFSTIQDRRRIRPRRNASISDAGEKSGLWHADVGVRL